MEEEKVERLGLAFWYRAEMVVPQQSVVRV